MSDLDQQKAWAMQWKAATPRLQQVRDRELQQLPATPMARVEEAPERHGLVIFQRWMMRQALLEARSRCD